MEITLKKIECKRCGHKWFPRVLAVKYCPKCKSPSWDKERKTKEVKP